MTTVSLLPRTLLLASALCLSALTPLSAAILMLDFGPTTVSGSSQSNSPYHTVNGSFTDTNWSQVTTAEEALIWSNGDAATGVSINIGVTTSTGSTLSLTNAPSGSITGTQITGGVYADTSVGRDGYFTGGGTGNLRAAGFQLTGLSAGTYDIYMVGRNTNLTNAHSQNFFASTSATSGNFDFSGYTSQTLSYAGGTEAATAAWVAGENYVKFTLTLGTDEYLNLAIQGADIDGADNELRGFLNAVQIVQVPEPTSAVLLLGTLSLSFLTNRRRK